MCAAPFGPFRNIGPVPFFKFIFKPGVLKDEMGKSDSITEAVEVFENGINVRRQSNLFETLDFNGQLEFAEPQHVVDLDSEFLGRRTSAR